MKTTTFMCIIFLSSVMIHSSLVAEQKKYNSKYAGQEARQIKSLSQQDIEDLSQGKGWGLAKAAELNGVPGPVHLLEMKKEIFLTPEQIQKITEIFQGMKKQAIELGNRYIELEKKLNQHFAEGKINNQLLQKDLDQITEVLKQLRFVHLSAHLKTPEILTPHQITFYNRLRGYSKNSDPCLNIPKGHNAEMWKKHNGCNN